MDDEPLDFLELRLNLGMTIFLFVVVGGLLLIMFLPLRLDLLTVLIFWALILPLNGLLGTGGLT